MLYRAKVNCDEGIRNCPYINENDISKYKKVNKYFVDNSGFGAEDERALTFNQFLTKVKKGKYYGIISSGQFQVYIGEYIKKLPKRG